MMNPVYFMNTEDLAKNNVILHHANVAFIHESFVQIEYYYDENEESETKKEAEWFDDFTYTL